MSDVSPLENKLFARRFDDGLVDLVVGIGLMIIGASWLFDAAIYGALAPALLVPVWVAARKNMIEPRLEAVTFSAQRQAQTRGSMIGWFVFGVGVLLTEIAIFVYASRAEGSIFGRIDEVIVALPAALIAVGLLAGLMIGAWRFVGYAAAALGVAAFGALRPVEDPGVLILVIGGLVLGGGVTLLARFFKTHPMPEGEDAV